MRLFVSFFAFFFASSAFSAEPNVDKVQQILKQHLPVATVEYVEELNLYQIELTDGTVLFSNEAADRFIAGDLYGIENNTPVNLTERAKDKERVRQVQSIPIEDLIVFPEQGEQRGYMYVFTDIDCGYCRQLHSEMEVYNSNGIEVRYIAWPRCGIECESYTKTVSVWCAEDQRAAMTRAKNGENVKLATCANPVTEQYQLGVKLGLRGTPFLVLSTGATVPGYLPAAEVINRIHSN